MSIQLTAREILEFLARHQTHRSVKSIAELAGVDGGNLHASLSGRRPLPLDTIRRVCAAVGLKVANPEGQTPQLELVADTVMHLEVQVSEVPQLALVLHTLTPMPVKWRSVSKLWTELVDTSGVDDEQPGVYSLALARLPQGYVVIHVVWPSLREAQDSSRTYSQIQEQLGGCWMSKLDEGLSASDTLWIRLRAGLESVRSLDKLLGAQQEPTGEEWAQMLLNISRRGLTPNNVMELLGNAVLHGAPP